MSRQNIENLPPLREVISEYGLRAEKSFGQNFLLDLNLTQKIVRQASRLKGKHVIEIGPGPGGLTRALLLSEAETVTAIEFDQRCVEALQDLTEAAGDRFYLRHGDALQSNLQEIIAEGPRVIIANLPYNIATPLLIGWLKEICQTLRAYDELILMFQKEVADRIVAREGNKTYSRISVLSQWLCDAEIVMTLPPQAFTPPPKIRSAVVKLTPKATREDVSFETVEALTASAFGQRRKMLRQSLKPYVTLLDAAGIDETARAEDIPVEAFIKLAGLIN